MQMPDQNNYRHENKEEKKMIKKLVSFLLAAVMMASVLTGCGGSAPASAPEGGGNESPASGTGETAPNKDRIKIGVAIWAYTDALGKDVYDFLNYTAQALDCDVEFAANGFDTEETVANIENLIASGCDAIIVCNSSDGIMPKLIKTCDENGVYLAQFFRVINDEGVAQMAGESEYFLGCTHEDEESTGYNLGLKLAEKGVKNAGLISWNHGDATAEARYVGYTRAFEENGINLLAEQWEINTAEDAAKTTENFIAAYPEMEAIVVTGGSGEPLAGTINAIENLGKVGDIHVVSTDFLPTLREDIESGKISAMSGGHWADPFFSFMLAYNTVAGGYSDAEKPTEITMDMVYVASVEDVDNYNKWFLGDVPPYTAEEIQALSVTHNAAATLADLKAAAKALSLEDVMTRHEGMIS